MDEEQRLEELEEVEELEEAEEPEASEDDVRAEDEGYELVELELDEDDIVRYLEDEEGGRIGFVLLEDGEEVEYLYVDEDGDEGAELADGGAGDEDEFDLGITKEGVAETTKDMNAIYKDGIAVAAELKGAFDDIKGALDFSSFLKK